MSNINDSNNENDNINKEIQDDSKSVVNDADIEYFTVEENPDEPFDIKVAIVKKGAPREYIVLYNNVESANSIIKSLNKTDEATKRKYFDKLLSLARAGLVSSIANPELAEDALDKLKEEILLIEGRRIKNHYMKTLGIYSLVIALLSLMIYALFCCLFQSQELASFMLIGVGTMAGTWVSFGARKMQLKFDELSVIENDMMEPIIRLIFIYISSIIMALFFLTGIVQIKIGAIDSEDMISDYKVSLIFGIICGLVESRIGVTAYKYASDIIGKE